MGKSHNNIHVLPEEVGKLSDVGNRVCQCSRLHRYIHCWSCVAFRSRHAEMDDAAIKTETIWKHFCSAKIIRYFLNLFLSFFSYNLLHHFRAWKAFLLQLAEIFLPHLSRTKARSCALWSMRSFVSWASRSCKKMKILCKSLLSVIKLHFTSVEIWTGKNTGSGKTNIQVWYRSGKKRHSQTEFVVPDK